MRRPPYSKWDTIVYANSGSRRGRLLSADIQMEPARFKAERPIAVDCHELVKSYGMHKALDHVSLSIAANEFFTLLGPSGCGKTTLLRSIAGFSTPDSGSIRVHGQKLDGLPPYKRPINTV